MRCYINIFKKTEIHFASVVLRSPPPTILFWLTNNNTFRAHFFKWFCYSSFMLFSFQFFTHSLSLSRNVFDVSIVRLCVCSTWIDYFEILTLECFNETRLDRLTTICYVHAYKDMCITEMYLSAKCAFTLALQKKKTKK